MTARRRAGETLITIRYDLKWDGYTEEEIDLVVNQLPPYSHTAIQQRKYGKLSLLTFFTGIFIILMSIGMLLDGSYSYDMFSSSVPSNPSTTFSSLTAYLYMLMGISISLLSYRNYRKESKSGQAI